MIESIITAISFAVVFISVVVLCICVRKENAELHERIKMDEKVIDLHNLFNEAILLRVEKIESMVQEDDLK